MVGRVAVEAVAVAGNLEEVVGIMEVAVEVVDGIMEEAVAEAGNQVVDGAAVVVVAKKSLRYFR